MGSDFTIEVSIKAAEVMARLSRSVTEGSVFVISASGTPGPIRLMGKMGERSFRVFTTRPYSRGTPRLAFGRVEEAGEGSLVKVHIGLGAWNAFGMGLVLSVLTVLAGACVLLFRSLGGGGMGLRGPSGFALALWLTAAGGVLADWLRNRKDGPLLRRALKELFADVTVGVHERW